MKYPTQDLENALHALVRVDVSSLGVEVQLPVIYPSGDTATVVITQDADKIVVHDAGFAAMMLANHGMRLTPKLKARIIELSKHYGCEFTNDRMSRAVPYKGATELAGAVAIVANASRTIADQLLHMPTQPIVGQRTSVP